MASLANTAALYTSTLSGSYNVSTSSSMISELWEGDMCDITDLFRGKVL